MESSTSGLIGVIVAMDKELAQLKHLLCGISTKVVGPWQFECGRIENTDVVLLKCGIGKVNAAIGASELINRFHPDLVISTGVAGGADVRLNPLDVVVGSSYVYHDTYCGTESAYGQVPGLPARYDAASALVETALAIRQTPEQSAVRKKEETESKILSGLTVTGDWFVDSGEKMQEILDHFPEAMAVDMESCAIAQTCHIYHVPFISFRIISDVPLKDNKAAQYYEFWNRMAEGSFKVTKDFLSAIVKST